MGYRIRPLMAAMADAFSGAAIAQANLQGWTWCASRRRVQHRCPVVPPQ